jgi:hypothetical protein
MAPAKTLTASIAATPMTLEEPTKGMAPLSLFEPDEPGEPDEPDGDEVGRELPDAELGATGTEVPVADDIQLEAAALAEELEAELTVALPAKLQASEFFF